MDSQKAQKLGHTVLELVALCAQYEARFPGGGPSHSSPDEAWQMSAQIDEKQREIVNQLEREAMTEVPRHLSGWQTFTHYMGSSLAIHMLKAVGNLIYYCAKAEVKPMDISDKMIKDQQHIISRMLDPKIVHEWLKGA